MIIEVWEYATRWLWRLVGADGAILDRGDRTYPYVNDARCWGLVKHPGTPIQQLSLPDGPPERE